LSIAETKGPNGPFVISGLLFNNAGTVRFAAYGSHIKYFPDFEQSSKLRPIAKGVITRLARSAHLHAALRKAAGEMRSQEGSYDPMTDDSAHQIESWHAYGDAADLIERLLADR